MALETKPMPDGQMVLFVRFLIVFLFIFLLAYGWLCHAWQLDSPFLGLRHQPLITALDWHLETLRFLAVTRDRMPTSLLYVADVYMHELGQSTLWWTSVNGCLALALFVAFGYDSYIMARRNEFTRISQRHLSWGILIWFAASAAATAIALAIAHHAAGDASLTTLPAKLAGSALGLMPFAFLTRRIFRVGRPGQGLTDVQKAIDGMKKLVAGRAFDPSSYFDTGKGIFLGVSDAKPVYVPLRQFRSTHCEILGETGTGKTVEAANIIAQCVRAGENCWVFDPKEPAGDEHMQGVLYAQAQAAGVPLFLLNLNPGNGPQVNLLQGAQSHEVAELLINGFDLEKQGNNSDVHKNVDQIVAEDIAQLADEGELSFPLIAERYAVELMAARQADDRNRPRGFNLLLELGKFLRLQPFLCRRGLDLKALTERPCIVYVIGSTRNASVIAGQKILLFRVMQLISQRDRARGQYSCIFLDEFRYLLSPQALTMLSTIRDKQCHVILAHQSLKDLRNCGKLDPDAVHGAVVTNTGIKVVYRSKDPQTAEFFAKMSGTVGAIAGTANIDVGADGNRGAWREITRPLIEENCLINLPTGPAGSGLAVLYTPSDEARFLRVCALPKGDNPPLYEPPPDAIAPAAAAPRSGCLLKLADAVGPTAPAIPTPEDVL